MPLKDDYLRDPRQFLWKWVVRMPGGMGDGGATPMRGGDFMPTRKVIDPQQDLEATIRIGYDIAAAPVQVAWHEVRPGELKLVVQGTPNAANYAGHIPGTEWFDAYILPWNQGCSARMQLPAVTTTRCFFTAEMNGCCFSVGGQPNSPVTAHFNVGDIASPALREKEWQTMLTRTAQGQPMQNQMTVLRKWDVTAPTQSPRGFNNLRFGTAGPYQASATEQTHAAETFGRDLAALNLKIRTNSPPPLMDLKVSTMGIRDTTGNWSFFYQRNLFVQSPNVVPKLGKTGGVVKFFGQDNRVDQRVERYIPIGGSQYLILWPNGPGRMIVPPVQDDDGPDMAGLFG